MEITLIANPRTKHQSDALQATEIGLKKWGVNSIILSNSLSLPKTKHVAVWGWRKGLPLRKLGYDVLVWERGYIGNRFLYTSLGWNGLNGYAEFPPCVDDNGKRFKELGVEIKPWRHGGEYALILGQVPGDASLKGMDMIPWYEKIAREITLTHDIPVHFRPHPDVKKRGIIQIVRGTIRSVGTLDEALKDAVFTVCYNSNSSVDSVLNGVPCVIGDRGSMAYDMCSKSINEIIYPDREEWANRLAQKQWTAEEIKSGEALKGIICKLG